MYELLVVPYVFCTARCEFRTAADAPQAGDMMRRSLEI
jgi:hypothetical protein